MRDDVRRGEAVPPAAEWLLDNFHLVSATARSIRHDLPAAYYRRLPKIAAQELAGTARIAAMALELIRCSGGRLEADRLRRFVTAFQSSAPLTIGELWAWPTVLKLGLIEHLRTRADSPRRGQASPAPRKRARGCDREHPRRAPPCPGSPSGIRRPAPAALPRIWRSRRITTTGPRCRPGGARSVGRRRDPRGRATPGRRASVDREPDWQPSCGAILRLERVLRKREPGRTGTPARPGRCVPPDGFPQPRSLSPGGRRAGGSDWRIADARRAALRRTRTPDCRELPTISVPLTSATT